MHVYFGNILYNKKPSQRDIIVFVKQIVFINK